jgi:SAM-dependent methyltransferase
VSFLYWATKASRFYNRWTQPIAFLARNFITKSGKIFDTSQSGLCLDVGAGNSPYRAEIMKHWNIEKYISMDIAPTDSTVLIASAENMPLANDSIDLVVSFEVLAHLKKYSKCLDEMERVLRPEGKIIISVPFVYSECDMHDFHRWTLEGMEYELKSRGFDILSAKNRGGMFFALGCLGVWAMQHAVPGQRQGWRSQKNIFSVIRGVSVIILTALPLIFSWIALFIDGVLPRSGLYMGVLVCAQKKCN